MNTHRLFALAVLTLPLAAPALAATAVVGSGIGCSHGTLAAAVAAVEAADDGPHVIRVVTKIYAPTATVEIHEPVTVTGGYSTCTDQTPDGPAPSLQVGATTLAMVDGGGASTRFAVRFENLDVQGTAASGSQGLRIQGNVDVTLHDVEIYGMTRRAIDLKGYGAGASLRLAADEMAYIYQNGGEEYFGGAIACEDSSLVIEHTGFVQNSAVEGGGAIWLGNCDLELGSHVELYDNEALYGAAIGASSSQIENRAGSYPHWGVNTASSRGDALYLDYSTATFRDAVFQGNLDGGGGTVYVGYGSQLSMTATTTDCPTPVHGFCSAIVGATSTGEGALLWLQDGSTATLAGTRLHGGYSPVRGPIVVDDSQLVLERSAVVSNSGYTAVWIEGDATTSLSMRYVTMTDSDTVVTPLIVSAPGNVSPQLQILSSILWQENQPTVLGGEIGSPDIHCVLSSDEIPGDHVVVARDPHFVDPPYDLHLTVDSAAIDFCDDARLGAQIPDLDDELRGRDIVIVPNRFTGAVFDVGVDEHLGFAYQLLFADGFEGGNTMRWGQ